VLQQFEAFEHRVLRKEMKEEMLPKIAAWLFQHIIESDKPFARYAIDSHPDLACAGTK
jgi:hemerythrin